MIEVENNHVRVAPPAKQIPDPSAEGYCSECDHCQERAIWLCGACKEPLDPDSLGCDSCKLDYSHVYCDDTPTCMNPEAHACMTPAHEYLSQLSRLGWCYLPEGHTSPHYYLKKGDL